MYKNQCMMCSINLQINSGICQVQIKYVNYCTFLFLFLIHGFIQICFGLFNFFFFFCICFMNKKYYLSKLMLLNFHCQEYIISLKIHFFIDKKHMQWNLDAKVKVFNVLKVSVSSSDLQVIKKWLLDIGYTKRRMAKK